MVTSTAPLSKSRGCWLTIAFGAFSFLGFFKTISAEMGPSAIKRDNAGGVQTVLLAASKQQHPFDLFTNSSGGVDFEAYPNDDIVPWNNDLLVCHNTQQALSCSSDSNIKNLCCFEGPGGLVLQTQLWDYDPGMGPEDAFTVHGLSPGNCDGSYEQFCDLSGELLNATQTLLDFGQYELLETMKYYWKDNKENDSSLWEYEFNKHGTCFSTLRPGCYGYEYEGRENAIDYFKITLNLYHKLPTFEWLKNAGITPSDERTYDKEDILRALSGKFGYNPRISCDANNALNEVWYFFYVEGSLRNQKFKGTDSINDSNCPNNGIKFLPKRFPVPEVSDVDHSSQVPILEETAPLASMEILESSFSISTKAKTPTCPLDLPYSCTNDTVVDDLCCFEYPGGVILLTQFWDYNPGIGPDNEFTIHGLWPDNCDGTYAQFCDSSLRVNSVADIISQWDENLLTEMNRLWKDYRGNDENLWLHEYNKHGTCYSTIKPTCYGDSFDKSKRGDVYDFFKKTVALNSELPTYEWLQKDGVVPSTTATYTFDQIISALKNNFGAEPYIRCDSENALQEVWYFHHLRGSLIDGDYNRIDTLARSRCRSTGIKFSPKLKSKHPRPPTPPTPGDPDGAQRGFVIISGQRGCLIRNGHWFTSGSCATYTLIPLSTGSYTLKSSGGYCTLQNNKLTCSKSVSDPFEFNYNEQTGFIGANGNEMWSSDAVPKGQSQSIVSLGESGAVTFKLVWNRR